MSTSLEHFVCNDDSKEIPDFFSSWVSDHPEYNSVLVVVNKYVYDLSKNLHQVDPNDDTYDSYDSDSSDIHYDIITRCYIFDRLNWKLKRQFIIDPYLENAQPLEYDANQNDYIWCLSGDHGSDIELSTNFTSGRRCYSSPIMDIVTFSAPTIIYLTPLNRFVAYQDFLVTNYFAWEREVCQDKEDKWHMEFTIRGVNLQRGRNFIPLREPRELRKSSKRIEGIPLRSINQCSDPIHAYDGSAILLMWNSFEESKYWYQYLDLTKPDDNTGKSFSETSFLCLMPSRAHVFIPDACLYASFPWIVRFLTSFGLETRHEIELYDKATGALVRTISCDSKDNAHLLQTGMIVFTKKSNHQLILRISDILWQPANFFELARRFYHFSAHSLFERRLIRVVGHYIQYK